MKVSELRDVLYSHTDAGVSLTIKEALDSLQSKGKLSDSDELTLDKLGLVHRELNLLPMNPDLFMLALMPGANPNLKESALQYIEKMSAKLQK